MVHKALIGSFGLALVTTASAQAAGDPKKGELVFNQCKACRSLEAGKVLALLGESGSGKSVTLRAILGLHPGVAIEVAPGKERAMLAAVTLGIDAGGPARTEALEARLVGA